MAPTDQDASYGGRQTNVELSRAARRYANRDPREHFLPFCPNPPEKLGKVKMFPAAGAPRARSRVAQRLAGERPLPLRHAIPECLPFRVTRHRRMLPVS